jgi:carbohydrate-selective porin OprB
MFPTISIILNQLHLERILLVKPLAQPQVELFYRHRFSKNISITPGLIFLFNPGNRLGSDTTTIGVLRTTFTF